jgi:NADH:ubiquinone reductase (H+-translocating)
MTEPTRVLCLGGGWAAFYLARSLRRDIRAGRVDLRVVSRDNYHTFHGFIAEMLTARIQPINIANPMRHMVAPARFHNAEIERIDLERREVLTRRLIDDREYPLQYDHLVLTLGSVDDLARYPGIAEHTLRVKTYWDCFKARAHILTMMEAAEFETDPAERARLLSFVVVGGNFGGLEIAGELLEYLRQLTRREYPGIRAEEVRVVLVEGSARLLPEIAERLPSLVDYTEKQLRRLGLEVRTGVRVQAATREEALLNDGTRIQTRTIISCSGIAANPVLDGLPLERDPRGRVVVDETLRTTRFPEVWAAGDCAAVPHPHGGSCPPVAIYAMMGGRRIGRNVSRLLAGKPPKPFRFSGLGEAASMGHYKAIYHLKGLKLYGLPAWVAWRLTFFAFVPSWQRKLRLLADWMTTAVAGRDVVNVHMHEPFGMRREVYEPGQAIVRQGERGDRLYLIWSGEVDIVRSTGADAGEEHLATLGAGEHFGEMAVFDNVRRTASVRARTRTEVLALGKREALALSHTLRPFDTAVRRLPGTEPGAQDGAADPVSIAIPPR